MCDEYYDARMKAFWRAIAEAEEPEPRDLEADERFPIPIALQPVERATSKPKALVR